MSKVPRPPLRVSRRKATPGPSSLLRVPAAVALALTLVASLAPLGPLARAADAQTEGETPLADHSAIYLLYQTPDGDVSCRVATPAEIEPDGGRPQKIPLRQINHLSGKGSAATSASGGLTIILRGTPQLDANPEARQAFINAAAKWEALIASQITVTIDVDFGTTFFGEAYKSENTLGATSSGGYIPSYTTVRQRLISRAPAGSAEAALLNNLPASSLPTDIGNVTTVFVPTALARALGLNINESTAPVPRIGFNSNFSFDFDPTNGVVGTDFDSVAVHEIGHALGFNSFVGDRELRPDQQLMATVWDFYRFRPATGTPGTFSVAPRVLSSGVTNIDPHVHFAGGAELPLSTGKPDGTGGDGRQASHWKDDAQGVPFIGIMDPTIPRGRHETITENDLSAIDFFGYSVGARQAGGAAVQFGAQSYTAPETQRAAQITVTRSGSTAAAVSVDVRTVDNPAAVACNDTATLPGAAFARCDYATTVDTVTFAPGETAKTLAVPLIDDTYGEPAETVQLALANPSAGAQLGAQAGATLLILSDEGPGQNGAPNPIAGVPFFVRQHYLDFLSREPEAGEPWSDVLNKCGDQFNQSAAAPSAGCDRILISSAFFGSQEFELKGRYAFRFYKAAFGRLPQYSEIVSDMRQLTGATGPEVIARRAAFPASFAQRDDFVNAFAAMSNEQFVNTLMNRYGAGLLLINTRHPSDPENGQKVGLSRTGMTAALNSGQFTRAQVLRAVADSDEVSAAEFRPAFVAMQYYGYLRRTPEPSGYQAWLNYLNANPNDSRTMVNGFLNSQEYRLRFGRP
jgi:hypothetical protein